MKKHLSEIARTISIIGSGRVGYTVGEGLRHLGCRILFHDIDDSVIDRLKKLGHDATSDLKYVIDHSSLTFVCVPSLSVGGADLDMLTSAIKSIAYLLRDKQYYHLLVIKSTVLPTTTENIIIPLLDNSKKNLGQELGICVNPEFGTEATSTWTNNKEFNRDFFSQDRIVIGEYDDRSGELLEQLYQPLQKPIFRTDLRTAEMIKFASNLMLATKVSFWNEISLIAHRLSINSQQVANIVGLDSRIGKYGSVHGKAFGGRCLPKDLRAFLNFTHKYRYPSVLKAVQQVNDYMADNYGVQE